MADSDAAGPASSSSSHSTRPPLSASSPPVLPSARTTPSPYPPPSRPPSAQIRPSTASSSTSSRTVKKKPSKLSNSLQLETVAETEPVSASDDLLAKTVHKYLNTEYFSDEDEYRNLPTNTDALTEKQISVLIRAVTLGTSSLPLLPSTNFLTWIRFGLVYVMLF